MMKCPDCGSGRRKDGYHREGWFWLVCNRRYNLLADVYSPKNERCRNIQLEAELEILKDLDVSGLKVIATELAKTEPPYKWTSMWRDCGIRQSTIGKQLLRLCEKLGGEQ